MINRYGRGFTHCDCCGRTLYEYEDDVTHYEGETLCGDCYREIAEQEEDE